MSDGSGTHAFGYSATTLALDTETRSGLVPAALSFKRATTGVVGRSTGLRLGSDYDVTYGYDVNGRLGNVGWTVDGQSESVTYARLPSSELLASVAYGSGVTTTYAYEAGRDLKTQVKNVGGSATVSQYDYQYDAVGRRTSVANSGGAFAASAFSRWTYNDRNELIESGRYQGTNVGDTSSPVAAEHRAYSFDPIGNRQTAIEGAQTKAYNTNALNEYASVDGVVASYDSDGNLTNDGTRFVYDAENRLVSVEPVATGNGSVRVKMAYDYLGRRVQKVVEDAQEFLASGLVHEASHIAAGTHDIPLAGLARKPLRDWPTSAYELQSVVVDPLQRADQLLKGFWNTPGAVPPPGEP